MSQRLAQLEQTRACLRRPRFRFEVGLARDRGRLDFYKYRLRGSRLTFGQAATRLRSTLKWHDNHPKLGKLRITLKVLNWRHSALSKRSLIVKKWKMKVVVGKIRRDDLRVCANGVTFRFCRETSEGSLLRRNRDTSRFFGSSAVSPSQRFETLWFLECLPRSQIGARLSALRMHTRHVVV